MNQEAQRMRDFKRILATVKAGRVLSVDTIRDELTAAGLDGLTSGSLFRAACVRGWLIPTGTVTPSRERAAKGRLVRQYRRAALTNRRAA